MDEKRCLVSLFLWTPLVSTDGFLVSISKRGNIIMPCICNKAISCKSVAALCILWVIVIFLITRKKKHATNLEWCMHDHFLLTAPCILSYAGSASKPEVQSCKFHLFQVTQSYSLSTLKWDILYTQSMAPSWPKIKNKRQHTLRSKTAVLLLALYFSLHVFEGRSPLATKTLALEANNPPSCWFKVFW